MEVDFSEYMERKKQTKRFGQILNGVKVYRSQRPQRFASNPMNKDDSYCFLPDIEFSLETAVDPPEGSQRVWLFTPQETNQNSEITYETPSEEVASGDWVITKGDTENYE